MISVGAAYLNFVGTFWNLSQHFFQKLQHWVCCFNKQTNEPCSWKGMRGGSVVIERSQKKLHIDSGSVIVRISPPPSFLFLVPSSKLNVGYWHPKITSMVARGKRKCFWIVAISEELDYNICDEHLLGFCSSWKCVVTFQSRITI